MLAELGDDRTRFADARALKAYAGAAPITSASGKSLIVHHRKVKNQRLAAAGYVWAFASLRAPGLPQSPLRSATRRRRSTLQRATQRLQSDARLPAPLPTQRRDLQRTRGIPAAVEGNGLTT
ncbi:transposase [Nonomuraea sp. NPDC049269]|uniref:transposase n=1 Tax=Nonomuraea sp. NPDC049269 TaxID=3364349 RepID=UPI00371DA865